MRCAHLSGRCQCRSDNQYHDQLQRWQRAEQRSKMRKEPHVVDLANFLNSMGANIKGAGTDVIRIRGVERLHKTEYPIIPDQIEAGTFMFAAAATHGDVTVKNVIPKHLESISAKLSEIGCEVTESDDAVRVVASDRSNIHR